MEKKGTTDNKDPKYYTFQEYLENEHNSEVNEAFPDYSKMRYTEEEYLEMERASDVKHEYKTLQDTVHIQTVGVVLSMKDIYDRTSLIKQLQ